MKFISFVFLFGLLYARSVSADLPEHFTGIGMFTWRETLRDPKQLATKAAESNLSYVIVKSHDGVNWGTRLHGKWVPTLSKKVVQEFHQKNIRVYAYFTARLDKNRKGILRQVELAREALKLGADGLVADDLFLFGTSRTKAELYFSELRKLVDSRHGTVLAFSAFPHLLRNFNQPWDIAMKYSTHFLSQSYWRLFRQRNHPRMTPESSLAYTQANWDALRAYFPGYKCELIPVGQSYGSVTASQMDRFLERAYPYYRTVTFFRWDTMPTGGWDKIKAWGDKYAAFRKIENPSLINQFDPQKPKPNIKAKPELKLKPKLKQKLKPKPKSARPV